MFISLNAELQRVTEHLKNNQHDWRAQRTFQGLHTQRSQVYMRIYNLAPEQGLALAEKSGIKKLPEVTL
jgi:ribosomal protein S15P/S13E